ncbi:MAG TPA: S16 family serine protease [Anaerolineae bacterium]|nr:S16 family serine protease [Anaerolineae bacterium]
MNSPSGNDPPADPITWTEHTIKGGCNGVHSVYASDVDRDGDMDIIGAAGDAYRKQRIALPARALVGEVVGLAVAGEQGVIQRFEMQATKGHGRIVPLGSIQRVMRESIEAAAQYIRAHYKELGIASDWRENFDVAVLATMMGVPKEGPSAGVTMATGIVSALRNIPVRHDIAMTGEITIMGKVLGVGGVQAKLLAATEAGIKTVILPAQNEEDVRHLPDYIRKKVDVRYVNDIKEVLDLALLSH